MTLFNIQTGDALLEAANQEKLKNEQIMNNIFIATIVLTVLFIGLIIFLSFALKNHKAASIIVTLILLVTLSASLFVIYKTEINTGYYQCQNCGHKFVPEWDEAMFKAARFRVPEYCTRHLKCPECGETTWAEKVMFK